jgi:NADPH-dependent 2,4-dienoyl-CoA reductase/sulfur reductase-like enzyme/CxxC motif-containing protein
MGRIIYDVAVIGAGPAGTAAAIGAKEAGARKVLLLDRDAWLGGILHQCIHPGFGLKIFRKELTGPEYAEKYASRLGELDIDVRLDASVTAIDGGKRIVVSSRANGVTSIDAKAVVLAMGCRERTRGNIRVPGYRPAGVFTAGTAQRLVNLEGMMIGERIVVVGSGDIGLIMARRCTLEGAKVEAVIEKLPFPGGLNRNVAQCLKDFGIPLHLGRQVTFIEGKRRVTGVRLCGNGGPEPGEQRIECDTVLLSVGLIPEIELVRSTPIPVDPCTGGPVVDQLMHTGVDGFFAAGNLVQVYDLVDWVSIDGERAGRSAAQHAAGRLGKRGAVAGIRAGEGIKSAVPQVYSAYAGGERGAVPLYVRVRRMYERPVFRFTGANGFIWEVKKRYAVPSEIVTFDVSEFLPKAFEGGSLTVDVAERSPRVKAPKTVHDAAGGPGGVGGDDGRQEVPGARAVTVSCVLCPSSCLVRVYSSGGEVRTEGAQCPRGTRYAVREATDPRRTFTSTVRVVGGEIPVCSVRTTKPIPKDDWRKARGLIEGISVDAPVECGLKVIERFLEPGIDLVATKSVRAAAGT